jgi:dTDP-4-dehydrorhamnose 3,5-epimerase
MKIIKTKFKGLLIIKQDNFPDKRGSLRIIYNQKIIKHNKFVFDYCTTSFKNALRGMHFQHQKPQAKYVNVIKGKILDCVVDLRKKSKTFGKTFSIILSEKNSKSLYVPAGFAHGFCALEKENYVVYSCTKYRDSKNENGIIYNDKDLKINWPTKKPIVADKDRKNLSFINFKKRYIK